MSDNSFNAMFNKLMREADKRDRKHGTVATGLQREEANLADPDRGSGHANWNIREFKQSTGAVKGRGRLGGIKEIAH